MTTALLTRPAMRWAVPAAVTAVVVGAAVVVPQIADADADLPERTPMELMAELATAEASALSGTLVHTADAGIPEIPGLTSGSADIGSKSGLISSVLSGSTTIRIWYSDVNHIRLALQDDMVENDVIVSDDEMWFWSSADNTAQHLDLGSMSTDDLGKDLAHEAYETTPDEVANSVLSQLADTDISVADQVTVAGREAYELVIEPTDDGTLIDSVRVAFDGEFFEPLRVQVFSTSDTDDPSIEVGYTSISFGEPDSSVFEFAPPDGATVEEFDPSSWTSSDEASLFENAGDAELVGEGWTSVLMVPDVSMDDITSLAAGEETMDGLNELVTSQFDQVSGPYGSGVAYQTDLFSVLLLDDGRLLAGAVTIETLEEAAQAADSE